MVFDVRRGRISKEELEKKEQRCFDEWLDATLAKKGSELSYFELNLEV